MILTNICIQNLISVVFHDIIQDTILIQCEEGKEQSGIQYSVY